VLDITEGGLHVVYSALFTSKGVPRMVFENITGPPPGIPNGHYETLNE
jgi:hypothetical protein